MAKSVKLSSGYDMPIVGLGTWQSSKDDVEKAVTVALECGYKHIDTAAAYQNEDAIGKSLKKWFANGGKREELFITTKLPSYGNRPSEVETYVNLSLQLLGLDYIDMYLIHGPFTCYKGKDGQMLAKDKDGNILFDHSTDLVAVWKELEAQVKKGKVKSIGISNFTASQIERIVAIAEIKPSNLQLELQAYCQQRPIREVCAKHQIAVTAFSTLGSPGTSSDRKSESTLKMPNLLEHPVVQKIAKTHGKSTAQILLRHQIQEDIIVIPKSTTAERIKQNIDIFDFELSKDEMQQLNGLDKGEEGRIFRFSKMMKGIEQHPECPF